MKLRARVALVTSLLTVPMVTCLAALDVYTQQQAAEDELAELVAQKLTASEAARDCEQSPGRFALGPSDGTPPRASPGALGPREGAPPQGPPPGGFPGGAPQSPPPSGPLPGGFPGGPPGAPPPDTRGPTSSRAPSSGGAGSFSPRGVSEPPIPFDALRTHRAPARLVIYDRSLHAGSRAAELSSAQRRTLGEQGFVRASSLFSPGVVALWVKTPFSGERCAYVHARGTTEPWLGALLPPTRIWLAPVLVMFAAVLFSLGPALRRIRRLTLDVRRSSASGYQSGVSLSGNDELAELARAFDGAAADVRAQLAEKDRREQALREFLANTTHDVMIPLTVLSGHLSTLREGALPAEHVPTAVAAMQEAHYIAAILQNLALVAKLDVTEPRLSRSRVDLSELVSRVMSRHKPVARQLGVGLESAVPDRAPWVDADVTMLEQAVSNVVYNAVRHNRRGGHVAVILEERGGEQPRFSLRVVDDGPGVTFALEKLIERGFRSDEARTRSPEGQGLGLHITHRILTLHGFELAFRASEYGGLEVEISGRSLSAPENVV